MAGLLDNYINPTYQAQAGGREKIATNGGYSGMSWDDFMRQTQGNSNFQQFNLSDDAGANPFHNLNPNSTGQGYSIASDPNNDKNHILMVPGADGKVQQMSVPKVNPAQMKAIAASLAVMGGGMAYGGAFGGAGAGASSGAGGIGTSAAGAGELGIADTIAGGLAEAGAAAGGGAGYAIPSYEAAAAAGLAGTGGASTLSTIGSGIKTALDVAKAGSLVNGLVNGGSSQVADQTVTQRSSMDPRMEQWLYGNGKPDNPGLLSGWMNAAAAPQNAQMQQFGNAAMGYLGQNGAQDMNAARQASYGMMNSGLTAPQMGSAVMNAAQVQAPSQNNLDLSGAYNQMIYGDSAQNPYLQGALNKGINQSNTAFQNLMTDATKGTQNLLGQIRGGAVLNNTMGSSRQGIAEGQAMDSFNTQMGRAASQHGQNITDTVLGAQAGAYENGQNRALSAMSGLGAQQYGVASQNAQMQQQAAMQNAQAQQQSLGANLQSQLQTQNLNSDRQQFGIGATQGLLNSAYGYGTNQDAYGLSRAGQQAGLLAPFTGLNSTTTQQQPLYQNKAGNIAAGVTAAAAAYPTAEKIFNSIWP